MYKHVISRRHAVNAHCFIVTSYCIHLKLTRYLADNKCAILESQYEPLGE